MCKQIQVQLVHTAKALRNAADALRRQPTRRREGAKHTTPRALSSVGGARCALRVMAARCLETTSLCAALPHGCADQTVVERARSVQVKRGMGG